MNVHATTSEEFSMSRCDALKNEDSSARVGQTGSLPWFLPCSLSGTSGNLPVCPTLFGGNNVISNRASYGTANLSIFHRRARDVARDGQAVLPERDRAALRGVGRRRDLPARDFQEGG